MLDWTAKEFTSQIFSQFFLAIQGFGGTDAIADRRPADKTEQPKGASLDLTWKSL